MLKIDEKSSGLLKELLANTLVCWKTVGKALGQFKHALKHFGSVEKAFEQALGLWKKWVS